MMAIGTNEYYMKKISDILLHNAVDFQGSPTQLSDHLYIGGYRDAQNTAYLKRLGITHVLNCAAYTVSKLNPYPRDSGIIKYEQIHADDSEHYNMIKHFSRAREFIDEAKRYGGKVLVHCAMGINRSGLICIAYVMVNENLQLLEAVRKVKIRRTSVLSNRGFQRQLIEFARKKSLL